MKTLTITAARKNLGQWLEKSAHGEDIGIVLPSSGKIIALRPVEVYSEDYAFTEYEITEKQMERVEKNLQSKVEAARKTGKLKPWKP